MVCIIKLQNNLSTSRRCRIQLVQLINDTKNNHVGDNCCNVQLVLTADVQSGRLGLRGVSEFLSFH